MTVARISLTQGQVEFISSKAKYPLFCAGYGAGKSYTMGLSSVLDSMHSSTAVIGVYEPFHDLVKKIAWPMVQMWLAELGITGKLNQQDSTIYTSTTGVGDFYFKSMDNIEALVGYETYTSHIDELDTMTAENAEKAFKKIMGRNRQAPKDLPQEHRIWVPKTKRWEAKNRISVYTTPEGFRFCHKMWDLKSENVAKNQEFKLYKGRTMDNSTLPEDYIQGLKNTYSSKQLKAYMEGEFVNMQSGSVYYNFDRQIHCTDRVVRPDDILHIGVDFNVDKTCGIVFVDDMENGIAGRIITSAVDEFVNCLDAPALAKAIKARYSSNKVICYPDCSGRNRTNANASESAIKALKDEGLEVRAKKKNPLIKDRVSNVVKMIEDGRLKVNVNKCPTLTTSLEQQAYNDKDEPDKTMDLDHPVDGMGYRLFYCFFKPKPVNFTFSFAQKT